MKLMASIISKDSLINGVHINEQQNLDQEPTFILFIKEANIAKHKLLLPSIPDS